MKTLYLIRHAKSSWKFPDLSDHDRPLNKRGERDAPEMGQRLRNKKITTDIIISSTANRAYTTAKEIASKIIFPVDEIIPNSNLFHAAPSGILQVIQQVDNKYQSLMIFGHNPGFTWAANQLGNLSIDNVPTCGIVSLSFSVDMWSNVDFGKGKLVFFNYPKKEGLH